MFFKKKAPTLCPLCGEEIKGMKKMTVQDGDICASCYLKAKSMAGDQVLDMSIQQVRDVLEGKPVEVADPGAPQACPVCGGAMPEYPTKVRDGYICEACDRLMRGDYSRKKTYRTLDEEEKEHSLLNYATEVEDELADCTLSFIKEMVEIEKTSQEEYLEEYGEQYENIFGVDEGFEYDLGAFDGGIKNARTLKGKLVLKGCIVKGAFSDGDKGFLIQNGEKIPVEILAAVACTGEEFDKEISGRAGKTTVSAHSYGWLVLDLDPAETTGDDVIVS